MLANHPNVLSGGGVATNIIGGTGLFADGTVAAPSISFLADQDTGIYRIGANNIGVAANGAKVLDVATTGLKVLGGGNSTIAFEATSTPSSFPRSIQFETNDGGKTFITANSFGYARSAAPAFNQTLTIGTNGSSTPNDIIFELGLNGTYTEKLRLADNFATFAGAVIAPSLTAQASTDLALAAGSGTQNITLTPSGTGYVGHIVTPANNSQGTAGGYFGVGFAISYSAQYGLAFGSNYSGQGWIQQQSFVGGAYYNLSLQASGGRLLVGTTVDSGALLQLGTNTVTSAGGMVFGTDVSLYRAAADVLALNSGDALQLGNAYVNTVAVSTGTVTIRDSTGTVYRLLCVV